MFASVRKWVLVGLSSLWLASSTLGVAQGQLRVPSPTPATLATNWGAVEAFILAEMRKHGLPGVAVAVTQGNETIWLKAYGQAGNNRPLTPQTPMYIGSTSKSFTALAIMQLVEAGKIELDAPVRRYLPWFHIADEQESQALTVADFLHQASGLSESAYNHSLPDDASLEEAVRSMGDMALTAPVGQQSMYFNMNYDVLALIVEKVSGEPYADYVTRHIFGPLEMQHSFTNPAQTADLAQGYSRLFGVAIPQAQPYRAYELGAGYLMSTAEDMAHYVVAMSNGGRYKISEVLAQRAMSALFTPGQQEGFAYGMGWFVDSVHGIPRIQHGGANETFKTYVDFYPTRHTGIVLLINEGYLIDSYVSGEQLFQGVEQLVLGLGTPDPAEGWAVPQFGYGLLLLVVGLGAFQGWQLWRLRGWPERARRMSAARRGLDVALNFLIPTAIMSFILWEFAQFFGYRFNLGYQLRMILTLQGMTDVGILMWVGIAPDYVQGVVKLYYLATGKIRSRTVAA